MASGQAEILLNTEKIEHFLKKDTVPDSLKEKIKFIQEVRKFAIDSLGLNNSENYTEIYDQKGKTLLWNISASEIFSLKAKRWKYPFIGSFPYKGFFDLEKAFEEYERLQNLGFDVRIRSVGGWSTLGYLKDPILSNMLFRSDGALAELIIHELTHSTVFVEDDIKLNENIATFVGREGALFFLKHKFGKNHQKYIFYKTRENDYNKFAKHMLHGAKKLDSLYQNFDDKISFELKHLKKMEMIKKIFENLDTISFMNKKRFKISTKYLPNNAYFMSFLRYNEKQDIFSTEKENIKHFIKKMKKLHQN
jgi:predicted aminopeptidase